MGTAEGTAEGTTHGTALRGILSTLSKVRPFLSALGFVVAAVALAYAPYLVNDFYLSVLNELLIYGLLAMSINILMGYTGLASLGHGAFFGIAAYTGAVLQVQHQQDFFVAFLAGIALATAASVLFGIIALRTTGLYFLMITLALNVLVFGVVYTYPALGAEQGIVGIVRPDFMLPDYLYYWFSLVVVAVAIVLIWRLVHSPFGLTLMGIRESESRMRTLGYNVFLHKLIAFTISGFFAGLAGSLYVFWEQYVSDATVNPQTSIEGVLAVIIGGIGTLFGPMLGAAIIVFARDIVSLQVHRWNTVLGIVLIVIVLFARNGILGAVQDWRLRRREAARRAARQAAGSAGDQQDGDGRTGGDGPGGDGSAPLGETAEPPAAGAPVPQADLT